MRFGLLSFVLVVSLNASTLQKLTLDEMIKQSTAIVHVKVSSSAAVMRGRNIYTFYQFQVLETLKAGNSAQSEVAVPGGSTAGLRQEVAGAPALAIGGNYVIFLWTSNSGLTQIIGLSQGLFNVVQDSSGNAELVRGAIASATVVSKSGQALNPAAVTISLSGLKAEIQKVLGN